MVVVELKAGKAPPQALTQIIGYMSSVRSEEAGRSVRGILVAHDFDNKLLAASSETPNVILIRYSVEFKFERP